MSEGFRCNYCDAPLLAADEMLLQICGLQEQVQKGKWAAETNQLLIDAIKAHRDAVTRRSRARDSAAQPPSLSTGFLGKHEQDAANRALWAVAGFGPSP